MIFKSYVRIVIVTIFVFAIAGCRSTVDQITMSTCKAVETNITKCSEIIADVISGENANVQSSVNEGDL